MTTTLIDIAPEPVRGVFTSHHSSDFHREIAHQNTILRVEIGSSMHGVTVSKDDDVDEMGVCIEPPHVALGIGVDDAPRFQQYEYRTQPVNGRSGPGDIDRIVYGLRKYARMVAQGNATVIMPLCVPQEKIRFMNDLGADLREHRERFLSKQCGERFLGYLNGQVRRYLNPDVVDSTHAARPELIEAYGWDTKTGYHALRIAIQGIQLLTTGEIALPMLPHHREYLLEVRQGVYTKEQVLADLARQVELLHTAMKVTTLPDAPDFALLNQWIPNLYRMHWQERGYHVPDSF